MNLNGHAANWLLQGPRAEAGAQPGVAGIRGRRWDLGVFGAARVDAGGVSALCACSFLLPGSLRTLLGPLGPFTWGKRELSLSLHPSGGGSRGCSVPGPPARAGIEGRGPGGGEPHRSLRGTAGETGGSPAQGPHQLPPFSPGCSLGVKCSACGGGGGCGVAWFARFPAILLGAPWPSSGHLDLPPAEHLLLCCL